MKRSSQISLVAVGREQGESWQTEDERLRASFSLFGLLKQQNLLYEVDVGFLYRHSL